MEQKYIVALEIGSSHIRAAVGVVDESGVLTILAVECSALRLDTECRGGEQPHKQAHQEARELSEHLSP